MTKQNQNSISPFLVFGQLSMLEGAEKALDGKVTPALSLEKLHSFFS